MKSFRYILFNTNSKKILYQSTNIFFLCHEKVQTVFQKCTRHIYISDHNFFVLNWRRKILILNLTSEWGILYFQFVTWPIKVYLALLCYFALIWPVCVLLQMRWMAWTQILVFMETKLNIFSKLQIKELKFMILISWLEVQDELKYGINV